MFRFGSAPSIPVSLTLIFHIRGLLPLSGVFSVISLLSSSKSVHFSLVASREHMAVSFSGNRKAASFLWESEIRLSFLKLTNPFQFINFNAVCHFLGNCVKFSPKSAPKT